MNTKRLESKAAILLLCLPLSLFACVTDTASVDDSTSDLASAPVDTGGGEPDTAAGAASTGSLPAAAIDTDLLRRWPRRHHGHSAPAPTTEPTTPPPAETTTPPPATTTPPPSTTTPPPSTTTPPPSTTTPPPTTTTPPPTTTTPPPSTTTPPPSTTTPPPSSPPPVIPTRAMPFRGVNLAGAEFGTAIPGVEGRDYEFPTPAEVDYFVGKGMNTFRIAFLWERIQPTANGALASTYASKLDSIVAYATSKGAFAIIEPHNFARYYGSVVGTTTVPNGVMADLWKRLATRYAANPRVMFNLMNEPRDMPTEQWVSAANASISAIRQAGATQAIHVPGNGWTGAHSWTSNWYGTANSVAMLKITDPVDNVYFEVHQYLDADSGGGGSSCVSATIGVERMKGFIDWLRANKKKGFLGEFAGTNTSVCQSAVKNMLDNLMQNTDVMVGWAWWAAGPAWGEYQLTIEPKAGVDRPQMAWLKPYL